MSLYCIKSDGEEVFTYNSPDLRGTQGVTTENRTPLYITICSSGNICYSDDMSLYCIKSDGEEVFTYRHYTVRTVIQSNKHNSRIEPTLIPLTNI